MQEQLLRTSLPGGEVDRAGQATHSAATEKKPGVAQHVSICAQVVLGSMILQEGHQRGGVGLTVRSALSVRLASGPERAHANEVETRVARHLGGIFEEHFACRQYHPICNAQGSARNASA